MNCQHCGKHTASVQFTQVVDSQKQTQWLCAECASSEGLLEVSKPKPTLAIQAGIKKVTISSGSAAEVKAGRVRCADCQTSLAQVRRSGRVGCALCYETFSEYLEPLLRRIHESLEHVGSRPDDEDERTRRQAQLRTLRSELVTAIAHEDFEQAAALRDAIEQLGGDPDQPGDQA